MREWLHVLLVAIFPLLVDLVPLVATTVLDHLGNLVVGVVDFWLQLSTFGWSTNSDKGVPIKERHVIQGRHDRKDPEEDSD